MSIRPPWSISAAPTGEVTRVLVQKDIEEPDFYTAAGIRRPPKLLLSRYMVTVLRIVAAAGGRCTYSELMSGGKAVWATFRTQEGEKTIQTAIYAGMLFYDADCLYCLTKAGWAVYETVKDGPLPPPTHARRAHERAV